MSCLFAQRYDSNREDKDEDEALDTELDRSGLRADTVTALALVLFGGDEECTIIPNGLRHGESGLDERSWVYLLLHRHGERTCYTRRGGEYEKEEGAG